MERGRRGPEEVIVIMDGIVTLTMNPSVDKYATVDHVTPDRKLRCSKPRHDPGGGGINVSRAIHTLGGKAAAVYPAGGPLGKMLRALLDEEGIEQRPVSIQGLTRQNFAVMEKSSDRQYRFGMPGPELSDEELKRCLNEVESICSGCTYLVASGSLPPGAPADFYGRVARVAKDRGVRLIVDTSGEPLRHASNVGVFLLKPNLRELSHLAGRDLESESEQYEAARAIIDRSGTEVVVISLGAGGAVLVTADRNLEIRAPTVRIRSKVGAGDSMLGGITLAMARGDSLDDAVRLGVAAGAAAVMTPGTELCTREDTERLYEGLRRSA
jgi:6-phosphofructokinase 2